MGLHQPVANATGRGLMKYPWLHIPYHQLVLHYATGHGHHALLLHAPAGNGDDVLVCALSRWLLCQRRNGKKSCGKCHSCHLMRAGNHPDYHTLVPEKRKNNLGVELIRQIIERLYSHAHQKGAKVVWLSQVELLTEAASNALLKTLEEPLKNTYFLLGCRDPIRLLTTLRSRCLYWHLVCPNEQLSMEWLSRNARGHSVEHLTALRLYNGAPIAAKQLLQSERWQQRNSLCSALNASLPRHDMLSLLPIINQGDVEEYLHWLCTLLLDAIKLQKNAPSHVLNQDQNLLLHQLADRLSSISLLKIAYQWLICRHRLLTVVGVNRELLLTEQLVSWEKMLSISSHSPLHGL